MAKLYQRVTAIIWYLIAYYAKMLESLKSSSTALERGILGMCEISKCESSNLNFTRNWIFITIFLVFFFFQFENQDCISDFSPSQIPKRHLYCCFIFKSLQLFKLPIFSSRLWSVLVWSLRLGGDELYIYMGPLVLGSI